MTKINFTPEHMSKLKELAVKMLFTNGIVRGKLGTPMNIVELIHTTTVNQLNEIKASLAKKIETIEKQDEWISPDNDKLAALKETKELINLIVGYKRMVTERAEIEQKKKELSAKLTELKESQKTPEDRIKEMEAQLAALDEF